ncbi:non-canonical poly(A) polymerase [Maudiozyma humilis]|uniref:polynucleotide adenylyltransferase n=1 Tax=Maudiozyma humilis TaxID=51915 RepID=A0AAV5S360_MAUHU|nr:non-canonical poly(A) polymerase [Kazachstania humilis]
MGKKGQRKPFKKQVRRMRKSSFNKVQREAQVFHSEVDHFNNYESLTLDVSDSELAAESDSEFASQSSSESTVLFKDTNQKKQRTVPVAVVGSEGDSDDEDALRINGLESNSDFIAFSDSDSSSEAEDNFPSTATATDDDYTDASVSRSPSTTAVDDDNTALDKDSTARSRNSEYPWLLNHNHSTQRDVSKWLNLEIRDFIAYISPSKQEIETRNNTITKLRRAVKRLWPDSSLQVFGSYATDLYLPGSDIDCVIKSESGNLEHRSYLYELSRYLKSNRIAKQVEVIAHARVPIIKFVDVESDLHIDVSFERVNGIQVAKIIRGWLDDTPGLRELVLIVKQFLKSRRLNDVHTGGLGGMSIVCLIYSFLYLHPRLRSDEISPEDNLGVLLMDFFELYGKNFSFENVALAFHDDIPTYMPKSHWRALPPSRGSISLAIQDPLDASNNISRASYNVTGIRKAFSGAFDMLANKCYEMNEATFKDRVGKSILGRVIKYKGGARHFRDERELVKNRAIVENEAYHRKRSRTQMEDDDDDMFLGPSDDDLLTGGQNEMDMYHLSGPATKKQKKAKSKTKALPNREANAPPKPKKKASRKHTHNIDELMGISDDTEDSEPAKTAPAAKKHPLNAATVDAQTRRDYWLSKGQTLASVTIPSKKHT